MSSDGNNVFKALLSRYLASLIFNSCKLRKMMSSCLSNRFSNILIFQNLKLLESLIPLVPKYTTPNMMTVATGIPPHINII